MKKATSDFFHYIAHKGFSISYSSKYFLEAVIVAYFGENIQINFIDNGAEYILMARVSDNVCYSYSCFDFVPYEHFVMTVLYYLLHLRGAYDVIDETETMFAISKIERGQ